MKTVGERIKNRRKELGISQAELANRLEMGVSGISMVETNQRRVAVESLEKYAEALNTSVSYLLGYEVFEKGNDTKKPAKELIEAFRQKLFTYQTNNLLHNMDTVNQFCKRLESEEVTIEDLLDLFTRFT